MTKVEFAKCIAYLQAGVDKQVPEATVAVWWDVLGDLTVEQLQGAISAYLRTNRFPGLPATGLLRQLAGASSGATDPDQQGVLAWDTVLKAIRSLGGYVSVEWDDPAIPAAIDAVASSWVALCDTPSDELLRFVKPRFIEAWKAFKSAGVNGYSVSLGIVARDAGRIGGNAPTPVAAGSHAPTLIGFGKDQWAHEVDQRSPRLTFEPKFVQFDSGVGGYDDADAAEVDRQVQSLKAILAKRVGS